MLNFHLNFKKFLSVYIFNSPNPPTLPFSFKILPCHTIHLVNISNNAEIHALTNPVNNKWPKNFQPTLFGISKPTLLSDPKYLSPCQPFHHSSHAQFSKPDKLHEIDMANYPWPWKSFEPKIRIFVDGGWMKKRKEKYTTPAKYTKTVDHVPGNGASRCLSWISLTLVLFISYFFFSPSNSITPPNHVVFASSFFLLFTSSVCGAPTTAPVRLTIGLFMKEGAKNYSFAINRNTNIWTMNRGIILLVFMNFK